MSELIPTPLFSLAPGICHPPVGGFPTNKLEIIFTIAPKEEQHSKTYQVAWARL